MQHQGTGPPQQRRASRCVSKCDALLFPSRLEGFGYAPAEAMSCGKPVITSNISSLRKLLLIIKQAFVHP
ncbi:glycosyltransferase [Candidatus Reidiella endopervernicosa]|uniref:Glycosyltransferase n=1 Tax=Candidatus Reidiella endopervernicosa TaxID=2738883 RepID=A0A6N0I0P3_9GAMM|nr:glycosyltransferase [Candidatus Reidiella endopervernicosa]QKQ28197.1 glycosyltransferase [Candidatus Reidiella endopervernicosa]